MTSSNSSKQGIVTLSIQVLLTLFLCIPIIQTNSTLPLGGDWVFNFSRLDGLANALKSGTYPTGVYSFYFNGFGYGVPLFYPDFLLLPFAILRAIGLAFSPCIKIMYGIIIFTSTFTSYLAAKEMSKSSYVGNFVMIGYCTCQSQFLSMYGSWGFGNMLAFLFAPLIIAGTYNLTEKQFSKPWIICLAFVGMLLSHIISTVLSIIFVTIWCICRFNKLMETPRNIAKLLICALLCLTLTAFFWMPFLEQISAQDLNYQNIVMSMKDFVPSIRSLFIPRNSFSYGLATYLFLFFIPPVFLWNVHQYGFTSKYKKVLRYYVAVLLTIAFICCKPVWEFLTIYSPIDRQTPTRLNLFVYFFFFFVLALSFRYLKNLQPYGIPTICFLAACTSCFLSGYLKYKNINFEQISANPSLRDCAHQAGYGQEWLPTRTTIKEIYQHPHEKYLSPDQDFRAGHYLSSGGFTLDYKGEAGTYELPLLWYKGYQSQLIDNMGKSYDLKTSSSQRAFVTVTVDDSKPNGAIFTSYQRTRIHQIGIAISLTTLFIILLFFASSRVRLYLCRKKQLES